MKCKNCGARIFIAGKNAHCTQCGKAIVRDPRKKRNFFIGVGAAAAALIAMIILGIVGYDLSRRKDALLPGIYAGMSKQKMLATLKENYPSLAQGVMRKDPNAEERTTGQCYIAGTSYCNALGLNRAMMLEVTFITLHGKPCVDSYKLSLPYTVSVTESGGERIVAHDVETKIVPVLNEKYGASVPTTMEYDRTFNLKEHVWAELNRMDHLLGFSDYGKEALKDYNGTNFCCCITYSGASVAMLNKK